jgi:hypothetical protein
MPLNHSSTYSELTALQAELVGRYINECSNIDFLLGQILGRLLFTPDFVARVYADAMTASAKQLAISKAVEIQRVRFQGSVTSFDVLDRIDKLNASVEPIRGMRNRFAHFCWARDSDDGVFGAKFSAFLPHDRRHEKDLRTLTTDEIKSAHLTAFDIVEQLEMVLRSLPEFSEEEAVHEAAAKSRQLRERLSGDQNDVDSVE